jgi:hypothetical protein
MSETHIDPALEPARGPLHQAHSKGSEPEPLPEAKAEDPEPEPEAEAG